MCVLFTLIHICVSYIWQNELAILEFIHLLVETMDRHFGNVVSTLIQTSEKKKVIPLPILSPSLFLAAKYLLGFLSSTLVLFAILYLRPVIYRVYLGLQCELDIMFHLEKAHFMLEEMVMNGCIVETSKSNILGPIQLMDKAS